MKENQFVVLEICINNMQHLLQELLPEEKPACLQA